MSTADGSARSTAVTRAEGADGDTERAAGEGPAGGRVTEDATAGAGAGAGARIGARGRHNDPAKNWARMVASNGPGVRGALRLRLVLSELGMVFRRRRNQVALGVLVAVPIIIAAAVKIASPSSDPGAGAGEGPPFLDQITHNGVFVAFTALAVLLPLFLPLVLSIVAGDAVAGEASMGTLRYLLTVPVGRTRVLAVKYAGIVAYAVAATLLVAGVGAVTGLILFGNGPAVLLSGTQIGLGSALWRLFLVALYVGACLAAIGAIGLFASTLVEAPMAATGTTAGLAVASQILDVVPQVHAIHPYLPTHYWLSFGDLLRDPIATEQISKGLVSAVAYAAIFSALAWARFAGKDVTS